MCIVIDLFLARDCLVFVMKRRSLATGSHINCGYFFVYIIAILIALKIKTCLNKQTLQLTTYQYNYLCFGEAGGEQLCDSKNSSRDLLRCVFVIVGSYPQHHHLDKATDSQ